MKVSLLKINQIAFIIVLNILAVLGLITIAEFTVRLAGFGPPAPPHWNNQFGKHRKLGYTAVPHSRWSFVVTYEGKLTTNLGTANKSGFRPTVYNNDCKGCPTIIVLGDSATFSAEVNDSETWPEFTAQVLNKRGRAYKVVNYGMRGYNTVQAYFAMREAFKDIGDIEAVIYMFTRNDPAGNCPEDLYKILARPYPFIMKKRKDKLRIQEPIITQSWESKFRKNALQGGLIRNKIRYNSALISAIEYLFKDIDHRKPLREFDLSSDEEYLKQWNRGQADENMKMLAGTVNSPFQINSLRMLLRRMNRECGDRGIKFFVACTPTFIRAGHSGQQFRRLINMPAHRLDRWIKMIDELYDVVKEATIEVGGIYLDTDRDLLDDMGYREYAASPRDWHYSAYANNKIGEEIAKILLSSGF